MQRDDQDIDTNNHSKYWEQSRQHLGVGDRGGRGDKKSWNISLSSVIQKCLTGNYLWFIVTLSRGRVLVMYRYPNLICPHSTIAWHYQFEPKLCFFLSAIKLISASCWRWRRGGMSICCKASRLLLLTGAENNMMEKMKNDQHERLLRPDSNTNISEALQDWTVPEMGDRYSSEMIRS